MTERSPAALDAAEGSPRSSRHWFRIAGVLLVVGIIAVELVLGGPALLGAVARLRRPVWGWLGLALIAEAASMGMFARMQNRLLRAAGTRVRIFRSVQLAYAAHSLSISLPGGPAFSTAFNFSQMRRFGASSTGATWSIAVSALLSSAALALIGVLAAFLAHDSTDPSALVAAVLSALAIAVLVRIVAQRSRWLLGPTVWVLRLFNWLVRRPAERGVEAVTRFLHRLSAVHTRTRDLRVAMALAIGNWALDCTCFGLCCLAASASGLSVTSVVIAYAAGMAASTIPLVPAGFGIVDGALVLGLVAGGTPAADAIVADILYRLISFVLVAAVGWVLWVVLHRGSAAEVSTPEPRPAASGPAAARLRWTRRRSPTAASSGRSGRSRSGRPSSCRR